MYILSLPSLSIFNFCTFGLDFIPLLADGVQHETYIVCSQLHSELNPYNESEL